MTTPSDSDRAGELELKEEKSGPTLPASTRRIGAVLAIATLLLQAAGWFQGAPVLGGAAVDRRRHRAPRQHLGRAALVRCA